MELHQDAMTVSPERLRQAREQLGVGVPFQIFEASRVLELHTGLGVVLVPLPPREYLVGMQAAGGVRRYGVVKFEGIADGEGW